jgi:hypothetical protein
MKKMIFAALAASTFIATPALADTTTISGDVAPVCTIDGPPDTAGLNLTIGGPAQALGNVHIQCNSLNGYAATASSANGGLLNSNARSAARLSYSLETPYGAIALTTPQGITVSPGNQQSVDGYDVPVGVLVTGNSNGAPVFAGRYSDVITWTITAN